MIDLSKEKLIDLQTACRHRLLSTSTKPGRRKGCHLATIYRYITRGARGVNGEKVRLEIIRTPAGPRTSREAIVRFFAGVSNQDVGRLRQIDIAAREFASVLPGKLGRPTRKVA